MNDWVSLDAVRQRQGEVRDDIARERLGAFADERRYNATRRRYARWLVAAGRFLVNLGEAVDGDQSTRDGATERCV